MGTNVTDSWELLKENRNDGYTIVKKITAVLDSQNVIRLDCGHELQADSRGRFHVVQLRTNLFSVVCDKCVRFAVFGEGLDGEPSWAVCGTA